MKTIGIKLADGSFYPVLQEGSSNEVSLDLTTANNNQTKVMVDLYRSELGSMDDAEYVDSLQIENLVEHPNGELDLTFTVSIDEDQNLTAKIVDKETGAQSNSTITLVSRTNEERQNPDNYSIEETKAVAAMATGAGLLAAAKIAGKDDESIQENTENDIPLENTDLPTSDFDFESPENNPPMEDPLMDSFSFDEDKSAIPESAEQLPEAPAEDTELPKEDVSLPDMDFDLPNDDNADAPTSDFDFESTESNPPMEDPLMDTFSFDEDKSEGEKTVAEEAADAGIDSEITEESITEDSFDTSLPDEFADSNPLADIQTPETENDSNPLEESVAFEDSFPTETTENTESDPLADTESFDTSLPDDTFADISSISDTDSTDTMDTSLPDDIFADSNPLADVQTPETETPAESESTENDQIVEETFDDDMFNTPIDTSEDFSTPDFGSFDDSQQGPTYSDDKPAYNDNDSGIKWKILIPVIICVVCAIICLLVLFLLPKRIKKSKKDTQQTCVVEQVETEKTTETAAPTPEPVKEKVPAAKEDEVIIIEKAEEVVPLPPPPAEKPKNTRYKIKWGDTLWDIADTYYKNPWRYKYLARYNGIKNPDYIISGTYIIIPAE